MADRFTYLPQIGIYVALVWAAADLAPPWPSRRAAWAVASVLALAMFMAAAWRQTTFWRDSETLWIRALACTSRNGVAHQNLGAALADMNRFQEALPHYRQALEIDSLHNKVELHCGLAHILNQLGQPEEALAHYRKAVELRPRDADVHYCLATTLIRLGRSDEALAHYRRVVDIQPQNALAHCELGKLLAARGEANEALIHYATAAKIWPACATAHCELGGLLAERGQCEEAAAHLQRALKLDPGLAMAHYRLANLMVVEGRFEEALDHYRQALKIRPAFAMAHCKLAWLRATCPSASLRNGAEAIEHALQARRLCAGKKPEILDTLAAAYAEAGSFPEALATAREALELAARQNDTALADLLHDRIALYAAGKPFHQRRPVQSP
jgi:tetratricopeptide (TPR) repeat protein